MNREIKFRGKLEYNGKWIYGDLLQYENGDVAIFRDKLSSFGCECTEMLKRDRVIPDTIGQYTGMTDNDGNKIYEGDIIEYYVLDHYCINPDSESHLHEFDVCINKKRFAVRFNRCTFGVYEEKLFFSLDKPLLSCGITERELPFIKESIEKNRQFKTNGYSIDESIVGVKVIGNIHDNIDLIK